MHSSLVPLVLNNNTQSITGQYHSVIGNSFSTVASPEDVEPKLWQELLQCRSARIQVPFDESDADVTPLLSDEWLTSSERELRDNEARVKNIQKVQQARLDASRDAGGRNNSVVSPEVSDPNLLQEVAEQWERVKLSAGPAMINDSPMSNQSVQFSNKIKEEASSTGTSMEQVSLDDMVSKAKAIPNEETTVQYEAPTEPKETEPDYTEAEAKTEEEPTVPQEEAQAVPVGILRRSSRASKQTNRFDPGQDQSARTWTDSGVSAMSAIIDKVSMEVTQRERIDTIFLKIEEANQAMAQTPYAYAVRKTKDPNLPSFKEALSGDQSQEYWSAMDKEVRALEKRDTWSYVDKDKVKDKKRIIPSMWVMRRKVSPSGELKKFKARLTLRGDLMKKQYQSDDMDVYSPVCLWSSVRLVLILSLLLRLVTESIDFSNAFVQADIPKNEDIYLEPPVGFNTPKPDQLLRLNKSLYGANFSPVLWWSKIDAGLRKRGFTPSRMDPCLYVSQHTLICLFVDDLAIASTHQKHIDKLIQSFKDDGNEYNWQLTREGSLTEFLGIDITKSPDGKAFHLTQTGLIEKILDTTKMQDCGSKQNPMHSDGKPVASDKDGPPFNEDWSYRSVTGMLMYLATNSRPDIMYAVHSCARFNHCPKQSHGKAILHIVKYLKSTKKQGLILRPSQELSIDLMVDADFAGMYSTEDTQTPLSVKSRTGFVINFAGCPLLYVSKIQSEIALSTTESETIALSQGIRALIPIKRTVEHIAKYFELPGKNKLKVTALSQIFEDNAAVVQLGKSKRFTPRTRHISSKHWWSIDQIDNQKTLAIQKIDGKLNTADLMTKNVSQETFIRLRKILCGW